MKDSVLDSKVGLGDRCLHEGTHGRRISSTKRDLAGTSPSLISISTSRTSSFPLGVTVLKITLPGSKKPRRLTFSLDRRRSVPENLAPSRISNSRRTTLSLVLVLPLTEIFPKWAIFPFSKENSISTLFSPGTTFKVRRTFAKA